jgi:putative endonuclease
MDCNDATPFATYILSNYKKTVLYIGVTNDLNRRILEHKSKIDPNSFTAKYNVDRLVYFEKFQSVNDAIAREKQLKHWNREWKERLVNEKNPEWKDLFDYA